MAHLEGEPSLSRKKPGFTVQASPFNGVKLDLALICIFAIVLWVIHDRVTDSAFGQFVLLALYGVVCGAWIVLKTRRIARQQALLQGQEEG